MLDPYHDKTEYSTDHSHVKSRKIINSWIDNKEYYDAFRQLYPKSKSYSWRWDGNLSKNTDKKARLDIALITQSLMNNIVNVEYQFTSATDHATIIIELSTEIELKGVGTFKAPPFIQNNEEYSKRVIDSAIDVK